MEQLAFEFAPAEPPRLTNFLPGRNVELIAALRRFASGEPGETGFLLWGAPGAGKTHLLQGTAALAADAGVSARLYAEPDAVVVDDDWAKHELVLIDGVDTAGPAAMGRIFTLYNGLKEHGGRMLAASRTPLARLPLREDLRTRLGWGLVYEVLALTDAEKAAALIAYAAQRGFRLSAKVINYLLRHGRRDMRTLMATLGALDRLSLTAKRPVTVPLLKLWLLRQSPPLTGAGSANDHPGEGV